MNRKYARLKSGGPLMEVLVLTNGQALCHWYDGPVIREATLPLECITFVDDQPDDEDLCDE